MGLREPTERDLLGVGRLFGLHHLAIEDAVAQHQRPKVEAYGDHYFLVLRSLTYDDTTSQVETGDIAVFVGPTFVVTVRHGESKELAELRTRLEAQPELLAMGPSVVLHGIVDATVDTYVDVAQSLQDDIDALETAVFGDDVPDDSATIYSLRREILELKRAVVPLDAALTRMLTDFDLPDKVKPFFRDVRDHLGHVIEQVESMDVLLSSILQAHVAQIGLRQNNDMRKITAWAAIIAVPTFLAGVWGMNFKTMPELRWQIGYPLALGVMAAVAGYLYLTFKRSGWL
jgi:magnesium transporter